MESHLIFAWYNITFGILSWIPQHSPIFVSVEIITKNVELYHKPLEESHKAIYDECLKMENLGPEKRERNIIFVIVSDEYNNNVFLWWRDSMTRVYAAMGIYNICFANIVYESYKTCMGYLVMGIIIFISVYVWPRAILHPTVLSFLVTSACPFVTYFII